MLTKTYLFVAISIVLALLSGEAIACSCGSKPSVLEEFDRAEFVVIAKAISVEMKKGASKIDFEAQRKKDGYDESYRYVNAIKMQIVKVYKGSRNVDDVLTFISGDGVNCGMTFGKDSVGDSFLFYLGDNPPKQKYGVSFCGRSQRIVGYETDDLKYLNKLEKVRGKTRISGDLNCWWLPCPTVSNVKIKIVGENGTFETTTDEHGIYEIYDLPPGKYSVNPEISKGWKIDQFILRYSPAFRDGEGFFFGRQTDLSMGVPINLESGKHSGIDFYFEVDTAIRGRVLSPEGRPMDRVCVKAVSTELKEGDYRGRSDCTNEAGIFLISEIPPGKYILVANDDGKISADEPFGTLFYPKSLAFKEATPLEIKLGDRLDNVDIVVPNHEELVTVSGRLLYANGFPVIDERVSFNIINPPKNIEAEKITRTDKNGSFSFKILKGYKGRLVGETYVYEDKFKSCPNVYSEVKKTAGKDNGSSKTSQILIDGEEATSNLILKFNFPGCKIIESQNIPFSV